MDETTELRLHTLPAGRTLAFSEYGDPQGRPLFYAQGAPGSRLEGAFFHEAAIQYGFRLIATDRPGMGFSTFLPGRVLLDHPRDIAHLADSLDIDRFGLMGWSGGGANTLACTYALPGRVSFTIALCGYTNFAELPGAADMLHTQADRISARLAQRWPGLFRLFYEVLRLNVQYFPNAYYKALQSAVNDSDRRLMADPALKEHFIADQKEAVRQGRRGVAADAAVHYVDWGFRLQEFTGKVHVFHGTEDHLVPFAYAEHLAANIPHCELHRLPGQGHLFPAEYQSLILETAAAEIN